MVIPVWLVAFWTFFAVPKLSSIVFKWQVSFSSLAQVKKLGRDHKFLNFLWDFVLFRCIRSNFVMWIHFNVA